MSGHYLSPLAIVCTCGAFDSKGSTPTAASMVSDEIRQAKPQKVMASMMVRCLSVMVASVWLIRKERGLGLACNPQRF